MSECTHDCSTCSQNCASRQQPESLIEKPHELSNIKKVIGVVSGKGGVGKSLVTSLLAVTMQRRGFKSAVLDADITGPSIPKAFGIKEKAMGTENGILPCKTKTGIEVMSVNLLLENDTDPVVWRGPVIAGAVKQFWTDVVWGEVDYMFVDMPPGTGDIHLTMISEIKLDGAVIVSTPQQVAVADVVRGVEMFRHEQVAVPVLGVVENMAWFTPKELPNNRYYIFGKGGAARYAEEVGVDLLGEVPIIQDIMQGADDGVPAVNTHPQVAEVYQQIAQKVVDKIGK